MQDVVIIGGGQAGFSAVARLRGSGYRGRLTLICGEPDHPYQRPPLSKAYLLGRMERSQLKFRPPDYYREQQVDVRLGAWCERIDCQHRTVIVDGEEIPYDALLLATGAQPRALPSESGGTLSGVHTVRDLADVDTIRRSMLPGTDVLVVGGGYIGLEAAASAVGCGLKVTLIEASDRILQRVAAPQTSDWFRSLHNRHGVVMVEGVGLERLHGPGAVSHATLSNGQTIPATLVIVGIGIMPSIALAEAAGIAIENGIRTDRRCRTSEPSIWAAGDCASFPYGKTRIRLESVQNAIDQAEAAVDDMLGNGSDYAPVPWFWSDQYDTKLQIAGLNTGWDQIVVREDSTTGAASHWYFAQDRLLAVDAINQPRAYMVGKRLLDKGRSVTPGRVSDMATDLKSLLS